MSLKCSSAVKVAKAAGERGQLLKALRLGEEPGLGAGEERSTSVRTAASCAAVGFPFLFFFFLATELSLDD